MIEWKQPYRPIRQITKAESRNHFDICLGSLSMGTCEFCKLPSMDGCYNCEKYICEKHAIPFVFMENGRGQPLVVFNLCPKCAKPFIRKVPNGVSPGT